MHVRLAHPLYGEVRRRRAAQTTLRRLRGVVACELAATRPRDDVQAVVRRAALSVDSNLEPDVNLLLDAARGAAWMLDLPLANRLAEAAIAAGGRVEASLIRAFVLSWVGKGAVAEAVLADVDTGALTAVEQARVTFLRAVNLFFTLADPEAALALVARATSADRRSGIASKPSGVWPRRRWAIRAPPAHSRGPSAPVCCPIISSAA